MAGALGKAKNGVDHVDELDHLQDRSELSHQDLDKAFDTIISVEDTHKKRGYDVGKRVSERQQSIQGFNLGTKQGFEIGSEVGIYKGFAETWHQLLTSKNKNTIPVNRYASWNV